MLVQDAPVTQPIGRAVSFACYPLRIYLGSATGLDVCGALYDGAQIHGVSAIGGCQLWNSGWA
jgi:hypothetical protein